MSNTLLTVDVSLSLAEFRENRSSAIPRVYRPGRRRRPTPNQTTYRSKRTCRRPWTLLSNTRTTNPSWHDARPGSAQPADRIEYPHARGGEGSHHRFPRKTTVDISGQPSKKGPRRRLPIGAAAPFFLERPLNDPRVSLGSVVLVNGTMGHVTISAIGWRTRCTASSR